MRRLAVLLTLALPVLATADNVLRVGLFGLPRGLGNPHSSTAISEMHTWAALFDSLTRVDSRAQVQPALAISWRAIDDHTWRFELRQDVAFSNGEPFNAEAVVTNIDYLLSEEGLGLSVSRELAAIQNAIALNDHLLEIKTREPTLILPALLAGMRIVAPKHWRQLGPKGFARNPVGTGPYVVKSWSPARVTLAAFEDSWRAPQIETLELYEILEPASRLQGVQSDTLDVALALSADDLKQLQRLGGRGHASTGGAVTNLSFRTIKPGPLQDSRVRQALNYAIDKQLIVDVLLGGLTVAAGQPVPHYVHGYNSTLGVYEYDPEQARQLLHEAGYPNGFKLIAEVTPGGPHSSTELYGFVAQQLAAIGVELEVRGLPAAKMIRNAITGGFAGDAFSMAFDSKPSLDAQRSVSMHSCLRAVPWHCDRSLMPLIEAARTEFDAARREHLLQQIMQAYHDDPPAIYLFESVYLDGLHHRVGNYRPENGVINYHEITLAE